VITIFSPAPSAGLDAWNPEPANLPKINVQNVAAKTARKINEITIAHLIAA